MRKFIVSDLHGNGEVYASIIGYLESMSLLDKVELYINGDLIDRGPDSLEMLKDVKERMEGSGNITVHYLGGNHELMMYQAFLDMQKTGHIDHFGPWMANGGWVTEGELDCLPIEEADEYYKLMGTLDTYKKYHEKVAGQRILLVHAKPPKHVLYNCHLKIAANDQEVTDTVWTREAEYADYLFFRGPFLHYNDLSKKGYLVIKGHTPLQNKSFEYNKEQNYINIDGGCSYYATGDFAADHVPLVEVEDGKLTILTFNHNNEIIAGHIFDGEVKEMDELELVRSRVFIEHNLDNCRPKNQKLIKEMLEAY